MNGCGFLVAKSLIAIVKDNKAGLVIVLFDRQRDFTGLLRVIRRFWRPSVSSYGYTLSPLGSPQGAGRSLLGALEPLGLSVLVFPVLPFP